MKIDFSSLRKAAAALEEYVDFFNSDVAHNDPKLKEISRVAVIKTFELTYDLAVQTILEQLAQIVAHPAGLRSIPFNDLMRDAAKAGIIHHAPAYIDYRKVRRNASHAHDANEAEKIVAVVYNFLDDIRFLLKELEERNTE